MNFQSSYNRKQFISFLRNQFLPEDFEDHDEDVSISFKPHFIRNAVKIGEVPSIELNIYEIEHESENDPRVSLSRDSFRFLAHYGVQKTLIIFISKNSQNFRLSLVTVDLIWDEGKRVKKEYSNPRRYSFFLGPDAKIHTPEEYLVKKGRVKDFDDLKGRFSIEIVNKEFYTQIAILFTKLAGGKRKIGRLKFDEEGSLKLLSYSDDTLKKEFSVRLIGRLVFCWFLKKKSSDKGISLLPEELLSSEAVAKTRGFYHSILEPLFFAVLNTPVEERADKYEPLPWAQVPFLNGGLFTPGNHDFYDVDELGTSKYLNILIVPDQWIKELFEVFETYNFTINENTSVDVELSIEPEMLGRIFENLLAEINPETGETARKATGSYYTPRPIVEYMVDQSLKQYLLNQTGIKEEKITCLLSYEDDNVELTDAQKESVIDALDNIRIIDPACGSGAFPMGILQKMLLILQKVDPKSKNWLSRQLAKIDNKVVKKELEKKLKRENWDYVHKLGIIQSSIYGVDIQPIAVEISKLRFFLSLIVDESIDDKSPNRGIVPLPNLEFKFVAANSLIGLPHTARQSQSELFEARDDISELRNLRDAYFTCYGNEKRKIERNFQQIQDKMFEYTCKEMVTHKKTLETQTLKLSQWKPFSDDEASWFDSEWMFGVSDGFDIAIANPPYVRQEKIKHIKPALKKEYGDFFCGTADIYTYFYKRGIEVLKNNGHLCFIAPNKFMRAGYGKKTRELLAQEVTPLTVIDFCDLPIFDATTYPSIILIQKREPGRDDETLACTFNEAGQLEELEQTLRASGFTMQVSALKAEGWNLERPEVLSLMEKLRKAGTPLGEYVNGKFYYGIKTGLNEAFVIDEQTRKRLIAEDHKNKELIKPWLRGRDIKKWKAEWAELYLINIPSSANKQWPWTDRKSEKQAREKFKHTYPAVHDHLSQWEDKLRKRDDQGRFWWELRSCAYYEDFQQPKIIYPDIAQASKFTWDESKAFLGNTAYIIPTEKKWFLGLLNSQLIWWLYLHISSTIQGGFVRFIAQYMEQLPIPAISDKQKAPIIKCVQKIIANPDSPDVPHLEKEIDNLIYKLYDITAEEITIIEGEKK